MYKVEMLYSDGTTEELDETFKTELEANEYGCYMISCLHEGAEILHMSNPGDYPLDENTDDNFEVVEVDEDE